ncbi:MULTISPECIES: glutathione S-transferase family protein [unclassified Janthinobacterium]|uniref:glutathione S-transferase family protein n=1 Tax=unclassified Janthinobacterium TaxID=2610881 RepID=UPI001E652653|nr:MULTISPECIES: glutathione S-transferase family protein [unclassified Janthinobacterium]MCC7645900.1 glutathione S-transferase family protein [Janthinobacterium sp. EB271-G4-3-1]MCC7692787.1 glutathione S-transferase family protein [Janthinobacterium sp. EB271-G4-3-2]
MSLILYGHPFSSYTQKVLVALYENAMPFDVRRLAPDLPGHLQQWLERWPLRKFPLLVDGERNVAETSIIIEYLQLAHPGPLRLLPDDAMQALDVRFLDRYFDLHVMTPVQHAVGAALSGDAAKTEEGRAFAGDKLNLACAWLETRLAGKTWAAGDRFTLADCAAAPSLFYADWTQPIPAAPPLLRAYRARLLARPSFARAVDEARPYRRLFPPGAPQRD